MTAILRPRPEAADRFAAIRARLRLPLVGAPMFILSGPDLVAAQCRAGIIGSFPALNARPQEVLDGWLTDLRERLARHDRDQPDRPAAPFAVNLTVHRSNSRLDADLAACIRHRVPVVITSLGARADVVAEIQAYGGFVLHDIIHDTFARKAVSKGVDGLVAVAAGAGGHAGVQSPFALVQEIRRWWDGPLALSGAIASGSAILSALAMGADLAYVGSPFIATDEANAAPGYKQMILDCGAEDIVYSNAVTGVHGNYLGPSMRAAGMDPATAAPSAPGAIDYSSGTARPKAWKDVWGAGQGIGAVTRQQPAGALIDGWMGEFAAARAGIAARAAGFAADMAREEPT